MPAAGHLSLPQHQAPGTVADHLTTGRTKTMAVYAICDECDREYRLDDSLAGKLIRCKSCGADVEVPERRSSATRSRPAPPRSRPATRPQRSRAERNPPRDEYERRPRRRSSRKESGGMAYWQVRLLIGGAMALIVIVATALGIIEPRYRGSRSRATADRSTSPQKPYVPSFGNSSTGTTNSPSTSDLLAQQREASQRRMDEAQQRMQRETERMQREMDNMTRGFNQRPTFPSSGFGSAGRGSSPGPNFGRSRVPGSGIGGRSGFPSNRSGMPGGLPR